MSDTSKLFRNGMRALTGVLITALAATGVVLIGAFEAPDVQRDAHAVDVNTTQTNERSLVCAGSFAELGADPTHPEAAMPVGSATVTLAGPGEIRTLNTASVVTGSANEPLAAAQMQRLESERLDGVTASSCVEPVNEQWLVGGGSTLGVSTTLNLGNPTNVAATVQITVFDENGEVSDHQTAGVIVSPNSEQIVSLNGYAPDRDGFAVRVTSTGAPVAASLGVAKVNVLQPIGAATVQRQLRASTELVMPGIANTFEYAHEHEGEVRPGDAGPADVIPVRVQAIAPGTQPGMASVYAIDAEGNRTGVGTIELQPKQLGSLTVTTWPTAATTLVIEADVPVFGAAEGTAGTETLEDFEWFTPAPALEPETQTAAVVLPGGALFIANTGSVEAEVMLEDLRMSGSGGASNDDIVKLKTVTVQPGTSVQVDGVGSFAISSTQPIHAGMRMLASATLAAYPVTPLTERGGSLTVYTR